LTRRKLPDSKDWKERDISDWNCTTWHSYIIDRHTELFGVDYVPYRGWQAEKGMIKTLTTKYGNELIKAFIDVAITEYRPSREYPGTSFGWLYAYRTQTFQRVQADYMRRKEREARRVVASLSWDEINEWL
jgi:hypothetical protein